MKKSIAQFIKFSLVGVLNTVVDFVVFTLLTLIFSVDSSSNGWAVTLITLVSYSCGVLNSYLFNTRWTFKNDRKYQTRQEFLLFVAVNVVSYIVHNGVLLLFKDVIVLSDLHVMGFTVEAIYLCKLIAIPAGIIANFIGNKLFVFSGEAKQG